MLRPLAAVGSAALLTTGACGLHHRVALEPRHQADAVAAVAVSDDNQPSGIEKAEAYLQGLQFLQANYAAKIAGKPYFLANGQVVVDPPPPPPPPPVSTSSPAASESSGQPGGMWNCIRAHESGGLTNTHGVYNIGPAGAYGILPSTWHSLGLSGTAGAASPAEQDAAALRLYAQGGWHPWVGDGCGVG